MWTSAVDGPIFGSDVIRVIYPLFLLDKKNLEFSQIVTPRVPEHKKHTKFNRANRRQFALGLNP